ncbi:MAM and LDL-receptor class A domain-containing protein 1 [Lepisosteus oculatus]|uniref:MAM and LDL-receptor class A domain-containing protein 1 n=1 Tax=Lepisosteus oculatus TaxID=7918 RepID=UPI0037152472
MQRNSFHFHLYGRDVGNLRVIVQKRDGSKTVIWSHSNSTGNQWNAEYVNVGQSLENYWILFSSLPRLNLNDIPTATDDIALDDISFKNCETSYQPPVLPPFNCSFEADMCGWIQGGADDFDWERRSGPTESHNTGPVGDHTTGTGNYLYIESSMPRREGDVAQLRTPLLGSSGLHGYCLTFWYHMFGATVGTLRMYLQKSLHQPKTLIWQRKGTVGDEWRKAQIHVVLQDVHEIMLEATVGGPAGDIAIDDISFVPGTCPPSDLCDFEENDCNWIQETDDDYDWIRGFGGTPSADTGPSFDHTTNTATGHYFYLETSSPHRPGQKARMVSPAFPAGKNRCLQFWYHMYGVGIGTLNVYNQDECVGNQSLIFSQTGNQGVLWRFAQTSLEECQASSFRIVFEGIKGATDKGDIAIDDILVFNGPCSPAGYCDFETNLCGWTNIEVVDEGDWIRSRGNTPNINTGPGIDHTTNTTKGYYVYADSSVGSPGDRIMLVSEIFQPAVEGSCLSFWYHMYGQNIGNLSLYINNRTLHTNGNKLGSLIWRKSGNQGNNWSEGMVTVDFWEPYWFIFVYEKGLGLMGDVALDDIQLLLGLCSTSPSVTAVPTLPPTQMPGANDCDFEVDLCGWQQDPNEGSDWRRQQGSMGTGSLGPAEDHTTGSVRGHYILVEGNGQTEKAVARIRSPLVAVGLEGLCLMFWYHMYGGKVGSLIVSNGNASNKTMLWMKTGTWGPQWNYAQIHITGAHNIQIIFEGIREDGAIALDDISFNPDSCPSARECDFENGVCGFTQDNTNDFDWILESGSNNPIGPLIDHSYGSEYGHYVHFATPTPLQSPVKGYLDSPTYLPSRYCLKFWYYISGSGVRSLRVYGRRLQSLFKSMWSSEGTQEDEWLVAQVDIHSPAAFQVTFEGNIDSGVMSVIAVDDIDIREGACIPLGSCDFEDDSCTWKNAFELDQFDWQRRTGHSHTDASEPETDHTLGTIFGTYLLMDTSPPRVQNDTAWLLSPFLESPMIHCVKFWYYMQGSDIGSLTVKQQWADRSVVDLWTRHGNQSEKWLQGFALMSIDKLEKYRVIFEGVVGGGPKGDIAIDDLSIESGTLCLTEPLPPPSCQFQCGGGWGQCVTLSEVCNFKTDCESTADETFCGYDCTFEEEGACGWSDDSQGSYRWHIGSASTSELNLGPNYDHTTLTSHGHYIYVDTRFGSEGSQAILRSPQLKQASATCQIVFWYHMERSKTGALWLSHVIESRETLLWSLSEIQGDVWRREVVPLGRIVHEFQIVFQSHVSTVLEDIALDDISFENCALPEFKPQCVEQEFRCGRGSCVSADRLCDFTDDCGDNTDENNCDAYPGRCNFESGLCSWTPVSQDGVKWSVGTGGNKPLTELFPNRDHTTGTSAGHFLFIDIPNLPQGSHAARIGSPLLTSASQCELRFYYYLSSHKAGALRVYLRNSNDGPLELLWERQEKIGQYYERVAVALISQYPFQVIIEGSVRDLAGLGLAVDDISFSSGCRTYEGQLPPGSTQLPPTVSPCSDNDFQCGDNRCIPVFYCCDGVPHCSDGRDEATCGFK